jgi:flagellin-like hook-associated protein FlgL
VASDSDVAFASAFPNDPLSPALLAEDGCTPTSLLHDVRAQAARVGECLDQIARASDELTQVQLLVGQLRDVAVVSLNWALAPADRAMLQRQVDRLQAEIDAVAERTPIGDRLLYPSTTAWATSGTDERELSPFRALSTATLGIAGLAVRSTDQAFAASGALDVAAARLERTVATLNGATTRLQGMLDTLTGPTTMATGDLAIGSKAAALNATVTINARILSSPQEAIVAQGMLDSPFR